MKILAYGDIGRMVGPAALDKVVRYQRQGRATVTEMAADGSRPQGQVKGTRPQPSSVVIARAVAADGGVRIDGSCSCPVTFNCKHEAALLIESMATPREQQPCAARWTPALRRGSRRR